MEWDYEIVEDLGIIGRKENGNTKRLVLMKYFNNPPAYYIKEFKSDGTPGRNCAMTPDELSNLTELLAMR